MSVAPSGWLAANGAAVSRTTYAALFAAIGTLYGAGDGSTTFALPDMRGYFVRGSGTNADGTASGTFGQKQADDFKIHTHTTTSAGEHTHSYTAAKSDPGGGGGSGTSADPDPGQSTGKAGGHTHTINATGGTETRPRNIALLYCIKF
jgi:hypothetical protein